MLFLFMIPAMMLGFGALWTKYPPKKKNWVYGYRTAMSMKSQETWKFAHEYHARNWLFSGAILAILSTVAILLWGAELENYYSWILNAQIAVMLLSIVPTELALRRFFDKDGKRRRQ